MALWHHDVTYFEFSTIQNISAYLRRWWNIVKKDNVHAFLTTSFHKNFHSIKRNRHGASNTIIVQVWTPGHINGETGGTLWRAVCPLVTNLCFNTTNSFAVPLPKPQILLRFKNGISFPAKTTSTATVHMYLSKYFVLIFRLYSQHIYEIWHKLIYFIKIY